MSLLWSDPALVGGFRRLAGELCSISGGPRSILVTGPNGGEGATTAAAMLALAVTERQDSPALLIDANLEGRVLGSQPLERLSKPRTVRSRLRHD